MARRDRETSTAGYVAGILLLTFACLLRADRYNPELRSVPGVVGTAVGIAKLFFNVLVWTLLACIVADRYSPELTSLTRRPRD